MILIFSFVLSTAMADAIEMPSDDCPNGSYGYASHAGAWCQAGTCEATSECEQGQTCEEYSLCVEETEVPCGGMAQDTSCFVTKLEAFGPCNDDGSCDRGSCETAKRCVYPASEDTGAVSKNESCGRCSTTPSNTGLGLLLLTLGAVFYRRR